MNEDMEILPVIHPQRCDLDLGGANASNNPKAKVLIVQTAISKVLEKYTPIVQLFRVFCKFGEKSTVNI